MKFHLANRRIRVFCFSGHARTNKIVEREAKPFCAKSPRKQRPKKMSPIKVTLLGCKCEQREQTKRSAVGCLFFGGDEKVASTWEAANEQRTRNRLHSNGKSETDAELWRKKMRGVEEEMARKGEENAAAVEKERNKWRDEYCSCVAKIKWMV